MHIHPATDSFLNIFAGTNFVTAYGDRFLFNSLTDRGHFAKNFKKQRPSVVDRKIPEQK